MRLFFAAMRVVCALGGASVSVMLGLAVAGDFGVMSGMFLTVCGVVGAVGGYVVIDRFARQDEQRYRP